MSTDKTTLLNLRRQLLKNGYSPIPNRDKACFLENWPRVVIDEDKLAHWSRMRGATATGLRVEHGLCVIDIDINHRIAEDVMEAMLAVIPEDVDVERLERMGKGHKVAWYVRTDDLFSRLHTRRWIAPGDKPDDETHAVEIFGGASPRQFGSFGPHTIEDGKVKIAYRWAGESPADVPLHALPLVNKEQLFAMLDAAEAELKVQGFEPVPRTKRGEGTPGRIYDLTEDMEFELQSGPTVTYKELEQMVCVEGHTDRCSASWLEGSAAKNRTRCLISRSGSGHISIWESAGGDTHMPASLKPTDYSEKVDRIAEKLREKQDRRRTRLVDGDDHISGAAKLLASYAYMPSADKPIIPLWADDPDDAIKMVNFRTQLLPYCGIEIGPRGGEKKINPVDVWLSNPNRIIVAGVRMRPDKARPTFTEHGKTWLNTYRPPDLGDAFGGNPEGGISLIEQLVPDPRERQWFRQWLAYKWAHPHIPGPSLIMVARAFGTGRGTFGKFLKLLFGDRYVVNVPFKHFAGLTYQSQYTGWGLGALFAIVNESSASGDVSTYKTKHDVYEHLKEIVDSPPTERTYVLHGEGTVRAIASTTNIVLTNNPDAIPLPEDDRRFAVITNGDVREPMFWDYINDWMSRQVNIAAFARWLEQTDLSSYDPFAIPLSTIAKEEMSDMNKSPLDRLLLAALREMEGYFVPEQVLLAMAELEMRDNLDLPDHWQNIARREMRRHAYTVRYANGRKVTPQIGGKRYDVMHMEKSRAKAFDNAVDTRTLLGTNGDVFSPEKRHSSVSKLHSSLAKRRQLGLKLVKNEAKE